MQKYKTTKVLGDGAFGTVFQAINIKTNQVVAIKKMKQKYESWDECLQLRQIKSLRKLDHPNIAKLKQVLLVKSELHLVFQYLENNLYQEYSKRKQQGKPFQEIQIKRMLYQIASALAHMHKNGFFHRDLKPQNLLLSGPVVKLCDFGLAREIRSRPPFTDYVSTRWYRAPQLLLRSTTYNSPVDVFAFACIAAELYNLSPLFPGSNDMDQLSKIIKILGTPESSQWPQGFKLAKQINYNFPSQIGVNLYKLLPRASQNAIELLQGCFKYSSRKRMTFLEILKHDYFKGINKSINQEEQIPKKKHIIFEQKQKGEAIDLQKEQKKIDEFRMTKMKFRQTRKHQAFRSDPLKQLQKGHNIIQAKSNNKIQGKSNHKIEDASEDIDDIIRQLQEKKKRNSKKVEYKPIKIGRSSRQKFYTQNQKSKVETQVYSVKKPIKTQQQQLPRMPSKDKELGGFQKSKKNNIFAFNFQPASLPFLAQISPPVQKHYTPMINKHPKGVAQSLNDSRHRQSKRLNPYLPLSKAYNF